MTEALNITQALALADRLSTSDTARLDTELLLAHVLKKNRGYLYTWPERVLDDAQHAEFVALIERRAQGEPVAYIMGQQAFWSLDLEVNSSTLIPRPETELLVELALDRIGAESRVLDLGTGTGAIALALASELKQADVQGVDQSSDAVALANKNKLNNNIANADFYQSNWFDLVTGYFDLIVSNPPYVESNDPHLAQGDVRFEPESALVSGADGLDDLRKIISDARNYLHDRAWLMVEHGYNQANAVQLLFSQAGFDDVHTVKDLSNNDRVTLGCWCED